MKRFEIAGSDYFDADEAQAEIDRLKISHARYEKLRTLNPRQFSGLYDQNIKTGMLFDDLVDELCRGAQ